MECPEGMEEGVWAASWGLTVAQWRVRLEIARDEERNGMEASGGVRRTVSMKEALLSLREGYAQEVGEEVASGGRLADIAARQGMSAGALRAWIFADADRLAAYEAGLRGRAEALADEALEYRDRAIEIADGAWVEEVQVSKLQVDTRFKAAALNMQLAGKYDPRRFGEDRTLKLETSGRSEGELVEQLRELTKQPEMREILRMLLSEGAEVEPGATVIDGEVGTDTGGETQGEKGVS